MDNIYNKFKFLKEKVDKDVPSILKLLYGPETLEKDENGHPWIFASFDPESISNSYIELSRNRQIKSLPENLNVEGDLILNWLPSLYSLPRGLVIHGSLCLQNIPLESLPQDIVIEGSLHIFNCHKLLSLPYNLHVEGMSLTSCSRLRTLPDGLRLNTELHIRDTHISSIPRGLHAPRVEFYSENRNIPVVVDKSEEYIKREIRKAGGKVKEVVIHLE